MGYLDAEGLAYFWGKVKGYVDEHGGSPAGGNPIGTVISFMGTTAPEDYLVCDGAAYNVADYPKLAAFFAEQFGEANHFGGDGSTTFAVPDLRNLFLRGYHGEAEEQLSWDIGKKQPGTQQPNILAGGTDKTIGHYIGSNFSYVAYPDSIPEKYNRVRFASAPYLSEDLGTEVASTFTSRPVNMAVLYCIKAVESSPVSDGAGEVYSTEETRIGTWIDGKPLYQKVFQGFLASGAGWSTIGALDADESAVMISGWIVDNSGSLVAIPYSGLIILIASANGYVSTKLEVSHENYNGSPVTAVVKYTKTTD